MPLVHIHSDEEELGHVYTPEIGLATTPGLFLKALLITHRMLQLR